MPSLSRETAIDGQDRAGNKGTSWGRQKENSFGYLAGLGNAAERMKASRACPCFISVF